MPIDPGKLDALKSLAMGGSAGLDSYNQAKQAEQASRTSALQGALGGQDVATAAAKAQGQYAPAVNTQGFANAGDLAPAANQYLSQAASKLAAKNYEDQQNLTMQGEALARQQSQMSEADRMAYLQGAANQAAQNQQQGVAQQFAAQPLSDLAGQKQALRQQLTAFDQNLQMQAPGVVANPEVQQKRGDILRQMAAVDEAYKSNAERYAGALGTDTKGLLESYGTENPNKVNDLLGYLNPKAAEAQGMASRAVETEQQKRLRDLAPMFGIDPMKAAGMFPEGEGNWQKGVAGKAAANDYIAGTSKQQQAAQDEAVGSTLGFSSGKDYTNFKNSANMDDKTVDSLMGSSEFKALGDISDAFIAQDPNAKIPGTDTPVSSFGSGREGFKAALQALVNGEGAHALVHPDGTPYSTKDKANLIRLADQYYGSQVFGTQGKGTTDTAAP